MLIVVTSSPRVAPGLLTLRAWEALRANPVLTGTPEHPLLPSLAEAGIAVETVTPDPQAIARRAAAGIAADSAIGSPMLVTRVASPAPKEPAPSMTTRAAFSSIPRVIQVQARSGPAGEVGNTA